jgi:aminopeptidase N
MTGLVRVVAQRRKIESGDEPDKGLSPRSLALPRAHPPNDLPLMLLHVIALGIAGSIGGGAPTEPDSLMAPGVSSELAAARRARISGLQYELHLDVTRPDTAVGRLLSRFMLASQGDVIVDFRGLRLRRVRANGATLPSVEYNGHHVRIPASAVGMGSNRLEFEFDSRIAPAGASIIKVRDPVDSATYLYTLLVPSDAQQLFPAFDQPDLKARVSLTLTTPNGWTALSNGALVRRDSTVSATTHVFAETRPISTYLIAFAAGPWATLTSPASGRPISLYVRRSRAAEVDADSIIVHNDRGLRWLERYFAYRYPFGKLDLLLAPAFPFGGMEHPGAIFYSEERFLFREPPTLPQRLGRNATIYHEVAHQWFGDLVTMRWFDDLWLKEGFATYMAARMQASLDPGSDAWKSFYLRNKPAAYAVDASDGTTPVWQELANLDQAKSNYGAIVYNKAPSVLKQLEFLVGEAAFQGGLQRFLRRYEFGNATWQDLLESIGSTWGQPLDAWGRAYILRRGMPVIEQRVDVRDGRLVRLALVQRPARGVSGSGPWPIRAEVLVAPRDGSPVRIPVTMTGDTTIVADASGLPEPAWVFANAGDQAYALVLLDPASVSSLEESLGAVTDPFQRAMLWGALWDLVREAELAPGRFVRLALRELPRETDEQIAAGILSRLTRAIGAYLPDSARMRHLAETESVLLSGALDARRAYGIRRAHLDAFVRVAGTPDALARLERLLEASDLAGLPVGAPTRWTIVTRLVASGTPSAAARLAAELERDRTPEGARRAFMAAAATPSAAVKREYFTRYFADADLNEDWATASLDAFNAAESRGLSLPYLRAALDSLPWIQQNRRIFYLGSWLGSFLDGQVSPDAAAIVDAFLKDNPGLPLDLRLKVLQAGDELRRTVTIRGRFRE